MDTWQKHYYHEELQKQRSKENRKFQIEANSEQ